jgi:hypothetical protein
MSFLNQTILLLKSILVLVYKVSVNKFLPRAPVGRSTSVRRRKDLPNTCRFGTGGREEFRVFLCELCTCLHGAASGAYAKASAPACIGRAWREVSGFMDIL